MEQILYESELFTLGKYSLPPTDPLWHELNVISRGPIAAFPHSNVVISHVGREPVLVTPNHVAFYNGGERYRRRLHDTTHRCVFVRFAPSLVAESTGGRTELPFQYGPSAADAYYAQHVVVRYLEAETEPDPLYVEETLSHALARVIDDALSLHRIRRRPRASTELAHHELTEAAKALLAEDATERRPLAFYARRLHTSEFHLARVFRSATGFSLHGYRRQLRLRLALDHLEARDVELSTLAHRLGFASHSHFTDTFRQVFGVSPSVARDELGRRGRRELRRVVGATL
jgi:AraC family transcriptional regulator